MAYHQHTNGMMLASSGANHNFTKGHNLMSSLGVIPMPQMAASSHGTYPLAATPLVIDETSTAAADNTIH